MKSKLRDAELTELIGKTLKEYKICSTANWTLVEREKVEKNKATGEPIDIDTLSDQDFLRDILEFRMDDGTTYKMYHQQDCCESVWLDEWSKEELDNLVGSKIKKVSIKSNQELDKDDQSKTWTFYEIWAENGAIANLRWIGESNGYYSEEVDFVQVLGDIDEDI